MTGGDLAGIEESRARVYAWAYRILRNHDDALDATQDVLVRALAAPRTEHPVAWLRRVTINLCIDQLRRRRPTGSGAEPEAPDAETPEVAERRTRLLQALEELTPPQRSVLVAKACDGETFEAIAQSMGIAASTAKTHYVRALRRMRDLLGPREGDLS